MSVATVSPEQKQKWAVAIQEFANDVFKKHPTLDGKFIPVLIEEVTALGLAKEYISARSLWACFRNCVADGRIQLPQEEPVLTAEQIEKLKATFPVVIKYKDRELTQRERNAMSGVERQSARKTHAEKEPEDTTAGFGSIRGMLQKQSLRAEYLNLKGRAESLRDNTHAKTYAARKAALQELAENPRYSSVKD